MILPFPFLRSFATPPFIINCYHLLVYLH
jgi:hypothetical protein